MKHPHRAAMGVLFVRAAGVHLICAAAVRQGSLFQSGAYSLDNAPQATAKNLGLDILRCLRRLEYNLDSFLRILR